MTAVTATGIRCVHWFGSPIFWRRAGEGLRAGQVVTTGSYAGAIEVPLDELLTVHVRGAGRRDDQARPRA